MAQQARTTQVPGRVGIASPWMHLLPLALSGLLLGLAFPRPGWGWLAHVALAPATLLALRSVHWRRVAWSALLVFSLWWLVMIRWMIPVTTGGYIALSIVMALYFTAAMLSLRVLDRKFNLPMVVALPLVWVTFEYLRSTVPEGGFGWFALAHSQGPRFESDSPGRITQFADLFGQWGVSFLVAMTNGLIVDLLLRPLVKIDGRGVKRTSRAIRGGAVLWAVGFLAAWFYGQYRISQFSAATAPGPTIAVVQTNVPQDNKVFPTAEQLQEDWQRMLLLTFEAAEQAQRQQGKIDLFVWPETMVPVALNAEAIAFYESLGSGSHLFSGAIGDVARDLQSHLLVGAHANRDWRTIQLPDGREVQLPVTRYNSAYLYHPDGRQDPDRYDKIHRVPFGEYVPWVDRSPWLKGHFIRLFTPYGHDYSLRPGERYTVFELPGLANGNRPLRVVAPICFEDADPAVTRKLIYQQGAKRADVLINLTNDGWFAGSHQPWQHLQIAAFRSIENRVPTARSVNTGVSGFIDSVGRIGPLMRRNGSATQVDGAAFTQVRLDHRVTIYSRIGDLPVVSLTALTLLLVAAGLLRHCKRG